MIESLANLPPEILLRVLSFLQIPDLLQTSRTCRLLRDLARDPLLHLERLRLAACSLARALSKRASKASISPPNSWIWLSKTNLISRQISKSLIRIRLSHNLEQRPDAQNLVARAILLSCCANYDSLVSPALIQSHQAIQKRKLKDRLGKKLQRRPNVDNLVSLNIMPEECVRKAVSPGIIATRRKVIRESLKDGLRAWVERRALQAQKQKADEIESTETITVKGLVRRFAAKEVARVPGDRFDAISLEKKKAQMKWGRGVELARRREERNSGVNGACAHPTRAHVLGLKRFWEGVIRAAAT